MANRVVEYLSNFQNLRLKKAEKISPRLFPEIMGFFEEEPEVRAPNGNHQFVVPGNSFPALRAHLIRNAQVTANRRCSGVVHKSTYLIPQSAPHGPWNLKVGKPITGGITWQKGKFVMIDRGIKKAPLEKGIFVGTWSPHNWFHWTIDILPSIWLSRWLPANYEDYPLLIPAGVLEKETWREPFDLVSGSRSIVELSDSSYTRVRNLVWIDSPTAPGPKSLMMQTAPHFSAHRSALNAYRGFILSQLGIDESSIDQSRKIFLARKDGGNRPYNQDELIAVAEQFGFEPVFFENMPLRETILTMLGAKMVVGPHGAGWASALYCQPLTKGFLWTWEESKYDNWFANIAEIRKMRLEVSTEMKKFGPHWSFSSEILTAYLNRSLGN